MIALLKLYFCVQTWHNNMGDAGKNTVTASKKDFTHVTFKPDLGKFKMSHLNKDIVSLMIKLINFFFLTVKIAKANEWT